MFALMVFALVFAVAIVATPAGQIVFMKLRMFAHGAVFFVKSKDLPTTYKGSNAIPMKAGGHYENGQRKIRVVFIRHGQSVWNSIFNSFGMGWPKRVVMALLRELVDFFTNPFDSVVIDSPLSRKGEKDATDLSAFFRSASGKISFDPATSVVVSSNLRRAMETALTGVGPRLATTKERILVDSTLQEGSRNIDALTLSTERYKLAPMTFGSIKDPKQLVGYFDPRLNGGCKEIGVDVYMRMDKFLVHLFGGAGSDSITPATPSANGNADLKEVIVVGHSGYFRNFFRRFLPANSVHISKKNKMDNCAVVVFDLYRNESTGQIHVDEASIKPLYRGFK